MKVLVTGSGGLVGSSIKNLVKEYNTTNEFIFLTRKDGDLRIYDNVFNLFKKYNPDVVIHLASLVAGLYGNMENNYKYYVDNIKININILECCNIFETKRLINILSTCIFPDKNVTYPLTCDQILIGPPHYSNEGYAYAKRILYTGSKLLSKTKNIEIVNLIPTNLYGFNDNYNLKNAHVIPGLIHKTYLSDNLLVIKGDGKAKRQFLYADDFSKIILNFVEIELKCNFESLIISPSAKEEISIKELVNKICNYLNYNKKIIYDIEYDNGQMLKTTNNSDVLKYFPNFKFTNLDDGLKKTITYFVNNYDNIRK